MEEQIKNEDAKGVSEDCVEFLDVDAKVGINLVTISQNTLIPRVGETVFLPGESGEGSGTYEVIKITHIYTEEPEMKEVPAQTKLLKISIDVKRESS